MPSLDHDGLVRLFTNRPDLAVRLLRDVLQVDVPEAGVPRIGSADLTDLEPATRHADAVIVVEEQDESPALGIIVEIQLDTDPDKRFAWPAYMANLRARLRCDVELLVIAPRRRVARWAATPIRLGRGTIQPLVLGPASIPLIVDEADAVRDTELAVLGVMAHGRGPIERAVPAALAALGAALQLPDRVALLYYDLIMAALSRAARSALEELMRTEKKQPYMSELDRLHLAKGREEGKAEGKAEALLTILDARSIRVSATQRERILRSTDLHELDRWLRAAATVAQAEELFVD